MGKKRNESQKDVRFYNYVITKRKFEFEWYSKKSENYNVQAILSKASKKCNGEKGQPDFIYINEKKKLLILMENKDDISQHKNKNGISKPEKYAVDGIIHYLSFFLYDNIPTQSLKDYFKDWNIIGLAVSGDLNDSYNHLITTFIISDKKVEVMENIIDILDEEDYMNMFDNVDEENIIKNISISSKKINKWLRSVDSQKRPVLLSALMVCLFEVDGFQNDFRNGFNGWTQHSIINNMYTTIDEILQKEKIPQDKINVLKAELEFVKHDNDLNNTDVLRDILNELKDNIIPLFNKKSNYDIIGKFYEDFLRYAGVANVKKGIVLTPHHITTLFTELIDIKCNDIILDTCCGTGAFLIASMNKLISLINDSNMPNKDDAIKNIKNKQLIGFEKNSTMYSLSISNMLFRGDGKSQIFNYDCFSEKAEEELKKLEKNNIIPTIGFINPPYGGKDNTENPTKKEIQFLINLLEKVTRYVVMIAPLSTYFKDETLRKSILSKNTLKYVINMPEDLFLPNAATHTAIAVFETNKPHNDQEVIFYNLKDDGFVLSKSQGRTDSYNKWNEIKKDLLEKIKNPDKYNDGINLVKTKINRNDEWIIQAHATTDYSNLNEKDFINSIKEDMIFNAKKDLHIVDKNLDEVTVLEIIADYYKVSISEEA